MSETEISLGDIVKDRVSGFTGVVTMIGNHITGCTRYRVNPTDVSEANKGSLEFFYESQLEIVDDDSEFSDEGSESITDTEFELGQLVRDEISGFEGIAIVINYELWNCPSICVQSQTDADESEWYDDARLKLVSNEIQYEFDDVVAEEDQNEHNTGATEDFGGAQLSAPSNNAR